MLFGVMASEIHFIFFQNQNQINKNKNNNPKNLDNVKGPDNTMRSVSKGSALSQQPQVQEMGMTRAGQSWTAAKAQRRSVRGCQLLPKGSEAWMIPPNSGALSFFKNNIIFDVDAKWSWHLSCESLEVQRDRPGLHLALEGREGGRE